MRNEARMDKTIAHLETRLSDLSTNNEPVELSQWLYIFTHDVLGEVGFLDEVVTWEKLSRISIISPFT